MTDNQIDEAIAKHIRWQSNAPDWSWVNTLPPRYCRDLNAMHEAEKGLIKGDPGLWECYTNRLYTKYGIDGIHATARERAEAFLKTIGKWKD